MYHVKSKIKLGLLCGAFLSAYGHTQSALIPPPPSLADRVLALESSEKAQNEKILSLSNAVTKLQSLHAQQDSQIRSLQYQVSSQQQMINKVNVRVSEIEKRLGSVPQTFVISNVSIGAGIPENLYFKGVISSNHYLYATLSLEQNPVAFSQCAKVAKEASYQNLKMRVVAEKFENVKSPDGSLLQTLVSVAKSCELDYVIRPLPVTK